MWKNARMVQVPTNNGSLALEPLFIGTCSIVRLPLNHCSFGHEEGCFQPFLFNEDTCVHARLDNSHF